MRLAAAIQAAVANVSAPAAPEVTTAPSQRLRVRLNIAGMLYVNRTVDNTVA
jgi:hypothetical protein